MLNKIIKWKAVLPISLALLGSVATVSAQDINVDSFDFNISGMGWQNFTPINNAFTEVWDPNQDANGNPNSGSLYLTMNYPTLDNPNWSTGWVPVQQAFYIPGGISSSNYVTVEFDLKVDTTNSYVTQAGNYGYFSLTLNPPWESVVYAIMATTNGWQHIVGQISSVAPATNFSQVVIEFDSGGTDTRTNTLAVWIDNIKITAVPTSSTNRPPLTLAKAPAAGLTTLCNTAGDQYQRKMLRTANGNYSWNTATAVSNTTTYSITITNFPGTNYPGFISQIYLIPTLGVSIYGGIDDSSVDWDSANAMTLAINKNPDGTASGLLEYKVNSPQAFPVANSAFITNPSGPLGQWSISINNNTNVVLTGPDGTTNGFVMPDSDAANFQDPLYFYGGSQVGSAANIGQSATYSRFQVSGAAGANINDNFVAINSSIWARAGNTGNGAFITAADAKYWITWPLPDAGYNNLFATDDLKKSVSGGQWMTLPTTSTGWLDMGNGNRLAVINQSTIQSAFSYTPTNCFFELYQP